LKCTDTLWNHFLRGDKLVLYKKYFDEAIVDSCRGLSKFCPSPNCHNSILTIKEGANSVECKCGFRFCYECADYDIGDHAPTGCEEMVQWLRKASDESENLTWMMANTKKCPQCHSHIEKNGGCMHMTCRKCRHEFCWLCFGNWSGHSSCNKTEEVQKLEAEAEKNKNELEHYMFFFHRYDAHFKAMRVAESQNKKVEDRTALFMNLFGMRAQDMKFLEEATRQVYNNRNMLKNSYVYSYNIGNKKILPAEKNLFEYLQNDLERHTDTLSELLETNVEESGYNNFLEWKENVTNYTRVCEKFLDNFIEGATTNSLLHPDGEFLSENERLYFEHLESLRLMGVEKDVALPLLEKYQGNVQSVIEYIFGY